MTGEKENSSSRNPDPDSPVQRFRSSREPLQSLVRALVEDLLDRPVESLVRRGNLAADLTSVVQAIVQDPANSAWFGERLAELKASSKQWSSDGPIAEALPESALEPLRQLATQPLPLRRELARALLDHPAFHGLVRELLTKTLLGYSKQVAEFFPGGKTLTGLLGKTRGMVSTSLGDTTATLEHRATQFVEDTLAPNINRAASYLSEEGVAESIADWRGHILRVLLDQSVDQLVALLNQADPAEVTEQVDQLMAAFVEWPELEETIAEALDALLERPEGRCLRELIAGSSFETHVRPLIECQLVEAAWPFVQSDSFVAWYERFAGST